MTSISPGLPDPAALAALANAFFQAPANQEAAIPLAPTIPAMQDPADPPHGALCDNLEGYRWQRRTAARFSLSAAADRGRPSA